jgi:uncharacterized membrane protein YccF (DUF307 family)
VSTLGNILWFIFAGFWQGITWLFAGILCYITIIGIPLGRQCFKIATMAFVPFGKEVVYGGGATSIIANILWIIFLGIPLSLAAFINGVILCITIIGIPFGLQCFKQAKLALMPFGAEIRSINS